MNIRQLKRYFSASIKNVNAKRLFTFILIMRIMNFICRTLSEERQEDMSARPFVKKKLYADTKR